MNDDLESKEVEEKKYYQLIHPGGPGGIVLEEPKLQEQDKEALPVEYYAIAFFPKITGLGQATLGWPNTRETIARTPEAAITKFMDKLHKDCTWEQYHDAGHRVRKIRIIDLGDAQ